MLFWRPIGSLACWGIGHRRAVALIDQPNQSPNVANRPFVVRRKSEEQGGKVVAVLTDVAY